MIFVACFLILFGLSCVVFSCEGKALYSASLKVGLGGGGFALKKYIAYMRILILIQGCLKKSITLEIHHCSNLNA